MNTHFWKLISGLAICFGLPWFLLVFKPDVAEANVEPVPYSQEDEVEGISVYPDRSTLRFGSSDVGQKTYAAEGCA